MNKFYGDNIDKILPEYLLEATPFSNESRINFSKQLKAEEFFRTMYADGQSKEPENALFDKQIENALKDVDNIFAKVDLIHVAGYAGCGKTTFVRHLIWKHFGETALNENLIDCEGQTDIPELYRSILAKKICSDVMNGGNNLNLLQEVGQFHLAKFGRETIGALRILLDQINQKRDHMTESSVKKLLREQECFFQKSEQYIYYLLVVYFIWEFSSRTLYNFERPVIILFDNVDSLSDISIEKVFVMTLKRFINDCNYFFGLNMDNSEKYGQEKVSTLVRKAKFCCFLTTRLITIKKYFELDPDFEKVYGWISLDMPEHYYSHIEILSKRVNYYKCIESAKQSNAIQRLEEILAFATIAYRNNIFKRLFNGNLRFCIGALCKMVDCYSGTKLIEESNQIYSQKYFSNEMQGEANEGSTGILLSILLNYFKEAGVFTDKLHLSECQPDDKISLSRIILTILREKGGSSNFFDILLLLNPLFTIEEICGTIYDLSEAKRDTMRRMLTCDIMLSKTKDEFIKCGKCLLKDSDSELQHGEISLCISGQTYLDYVVPHFEFMLSRHKLDYDFIKNYNYHPLFSQSSERIIGNHHSEQMFVFERKIDWVYEDVRDCCINSISFSKRVMETYKMDRNTYINSSYFNYRTTGRDGSHGYRQSYESRLIFSHIGYIERYRRFLLFKHQNQQTEYLQEINKRLVNRIERYLKLYKNETLCFQTASQDKAAEFLLDQIETIASCGYKDFLTKIEIL